MKKEDLMIGDWFWWEAEGKKYPMQVTKETFALFDEDVWNFEPIPLTKEILEKNGFAKVLWERAYNLPDYRSDIWFSPSIDYFYFGFDCTSAQFNCQYVHELQHALKLCGINKDIEL